MNSSRKSTMGMRFVSAMIMMAVMLCRVVPSSAGELDTRRIWAGLELFPAMVAAVEGIQDKRTGDNTLTLVFVYRDRKNEAMSMAEHVNRIGKIRGMDLATRIVPFDRIHDDGLKPVAAVFLTQKSGTFLNDVIRFGQDQSALVFSPFEGDVEHGVSGGILISDIIKPYVNLSALTQAHLSLKPLFLRVSESYDP